MKKKYEERATLLKQMRAFADAHPTMTDDQVTEYTALEASYDAIDMMIKREERISGFEAGMQQPTTTPIDSDPAAQKTNSKEYIAGFDAYLAGTDLNKYKAAMTVGTNVDGGYTVPVTYQKTVVEKLNAMSATRSISNVIGTSSTTNIPTEGDAPTFAWIDEGAAYGETKSTFGNANIGAWKLGGIIKVSEELLNDTEINFDAYMAGQIAKGIDKAESAAFAVGDGTKKPTGYVTSATVGTSSTTSAVGATTADEVIDIYYDLKDEYRKRATWRMNDTVLKALDKLKDTTGKYILTSFTDGTSPTIKGRPIVVDNSMADMGAGNKFIVLGDFSYYQIADRGQMSIQRLNELYAGTGMVGFKVTVRVDAKVTQSEAFNAGANAAV